MKESSQEALGRARSLLERLGGLGYDFFTGVPCSLLGAIYRVLPEYGIPYHSATREDLAFGVAAGVALAGGRSVVMMQNSGLGLSINALFSLQKMYELPVLALITWRGHGPDAPEHVAMGRRLPAILNALELPWRLAFTEDAFAPDFHDAPAPRALLVLPGELE